MTQPVSIVLFWFWTALPKWHNHVCRSPCPAALDEVCPWLKRSWAWLGERCKSSFGDYNGELQNHWFCGGICLPQIGACYGLTQFGSGARDKSEEKWLSFSSLTAWLPLQGNTTIVISISHLSLQIQMRLKCARGTLSQPPLVFPITIFRDFVELYKHTTCT